jgi:hypothetical protein
MTWKRFESYFKVMYAGGFCFLALGAYILFPILFGLTLGMGFVNGHVHAAEAITGSIGAAFGWWVVWRERPGTKLWEERHRVEHHEAGI